MLFTPLNIEKSSKIKLVDLVSSSKIKQPVLGKNFIIIIPSTVKNENENFQLQKIRIYRDITLVFYC